MPKRKKNTPTPLYLLVGGGIVLIVTALLLFSQNNTAATQTTLQEEIPYPEIARVNLDEAKAALDLGTAVFLDVRSAEAFSAARISSSVNIPTAELETRLVELDPNAWIIPYCT